jgi:AraC-like DNA-binding protein
MQYENSEPDRLKFEKAARMLAENFELSVDGIAKEMYMSRSSFQKKFIRYFGMSPIEYRTKKRLKKAKLLLENTDIPIKEISDSLAFYDIAYFYKAFKREYGFTPNAYREIKKTFFSAAIY